MTAAASGGATPPNIRTSEALTQLHQKNNKALATYTQHEVNVTGNVITQDRLSSAVEGDIFIDSSGTIYVKGPSLNPERQITNSLNEWFSLPYSSSEAVLANNNDNTYTLYDAKEVKGFVEKYVGLPVDGRIPPPSQDDSPVNIKSLRVAAPPSSGTDKFTRKSLNLALLEEFGLIEETFDPVIPGGAAVGALLGGAIGGAFGAPAVGAAIGGAVGYLGTKTYRVTEGAEVKLTAGNNAWIDGDNNGRQTKDEAFLTRGTELPNYLSPLQSGASITIVPWYKPWEAS